MGKWNELMLYVIYAIYRLSVFLSCSIIKIIGKFYVGLAHTKKGNFFKI